MRFRRHIELEHGLKQIDIVPLINVFFLLLIFFMLSSSFMLQPVINVHLPRAVTSEAVGVENIEVVVSGENITYLNGKAVAMGELKSFLKEVAKRKQPILIKSDKRAAVGRVVEIWDTCRSLGITQLNIATNQE